MNIDEIKELYKMIAERDDSIGDLISKIADKDARIAELKMENESLRCCGNCMHSVVEYQNTSQCNNVLCEYADDKGVCEKWEKR